MKKFGAKKIGALAIAMALVTVGGVYATWTFSGASSTTGTSSITVGIADIATTTTGSGQYSIKTATGGTVSKIYTVDQYSDAITNIYSSTNTSGAYQYVVVMHNSTTYYIYDDSGTVKYTTDSTLSSGTALSGSNLGIDDHTAALCIAYGATITITYTADSSDTGSSAYNYGVNTQWYFDWSDGSETGPQVPIDTTTHLYSSTGTATSLFTLDASTYTIYTTDTNDATKAWTGATPSNGTFTYQLKGTDLFTYLKVANEIIIDTTDGYDALNSVLSNDNIKLNIVEAGSTLTTPSVTCVTTSGYETITIADSSNTASEVSGYYIGFMSGSADGTPVYSYTATDISAAINFSDILSGTTLMDGYHDGIYYIRVRAVATADSGKANSTWSTAAYTVTITTVDKTTSYTVAAIQ